MPDLSPRICLDCKKRFMARHYNVRRCPTCKEEHKIKYMREYNREYKKRQKECTKKPAKSIDEILAMAKAAGATSYGKFLEGKDL